MQAIIAILCLAVVFFGLNLFAQKLVPTNRGDDPGRRIAYRFLVYALFLIVLGMAIAIGFALDN